jgi:glycosyltransferase involved in cell wall biosynthesis
MNWVFLDFIRWDYDVATPLARPLGGSQSALCYLALALARRGQQVTTLTGTTSPRSISGVQCLRYEDIPAALFAPANTMTVVLNGPADMAAAVREAIPPGRPLILWTQHAHDQPAMLPLRDPACMALWDRILCISDWQKAMFQQHLGVPVARMEVLRNAISPAFAGLFPDEAQLGEAKSKELRLAYTSTPFRGLDVLLACFPAIRRRHPNCRLDVFSSMQVYGQASDRDPYQPLYAQCRATEGIAYRGSLSQTDLAKELTGVSVLAYPNTFAETSCIAVMEALAAGLLVVTSDLGALPETCAGWARLVQPIGPNRSQEQFAIDFARAVDKALGEVQGDRSGFARQRFEQSLAVNASCSWDVRAAEWEAAAAGWLKSDD